MKSKIIYFSLFILLSVNVFAMHSIPIVIKNALKAGNTAELARYFNTNLELVVLNKEDVYSKAQAEMILDDFFQKNEPSDFIIIHEDEAVAIGNLITSRGTYRVSITTLRINGQTYINQLKIEYENK